MTWVKLDDNFADHPAIAGLSDPAFRLYVSALCYCARYLTDGFVPAACLTKLGLRRPKPAADELVQHGRWSVEPDGYRIHGYLEYQESREKVKARREKTKQRVDRHRNGVTSGVSNGLGNDAPDPTRTRTTSIGSPAGRDRPPEPKPSDSYAASEAKRREALELEPSKAEADHAFPEGLHAARVAARSLKVVNGD